MKVLGGRRDTNSEPNKRRKIQVDILGKGREGITVNPENTVSDLKQSLNIGSNVRAVDERGQTLKNSEKLKDKNEINFVPNVKGGKN